MPGTDWVGWHAQYEAPDAPLYQRLEVVQDAIRDVLRMREGHELRVISMCAGDGRDLLGVLAMHPARAAVRARLVERDPALVDAARTAAKAAGLAHVEVVAGDAALTAAYEGAVPADLVLACGIFGNISDDDVRRTVETLPSLCAHQGVVIWTRHRRDPDLTPRIRAWFADAGFRERGFASPGPGSFAVGIHELERQPSALTLGRRMFTFIR